MSVEHWEEGKEGPFSEQALRKNLQARGFHVTRYVYPPGTFFPEHAHSTDKMDAVISGQFRIKTKNSDLILEKGDALSVPRGTLHSAEVIGDEPVISLDAVKFREMRELTSGI